MLDSHFDGKQLLILEKYQGMVRLAICDELFGDDQSQPRIIEVRRDPSVGNFAIRGEILMDKQEEEIVVIKLGEVDEWFFEETFRLRM